MTLTTGGVLVVMGWFLGRGGMPVSLESLMATLPFVIGGMAILLAARFRRSRLAGASALVGVMAWILSHGGDTAGIQSPPAASLLLVPPGLAVLALLGDHPVFSRRGLAQLLPAVVLGVCYWLLRSNLVPERVVRVMTPVQLAWALILGAVVLALFSYLFRRGVVDAAFLPALAALAVGLGQIHAGGSAIPALTAAQAIFLVAGAEEAYRLAFQDELTGLPGRRALEEALHRLRGSFAIAMVDIDHFKRFNDRFGHDAGDQVLRMVARELGRVPAGGRPYRYGGEEFVLLFPGLDRDAALTATEAVREAIARRRFHLRGPQRPKRKPRSPRPARGAPVVSISVSAGVASTTSKRRSSQEVLLAADGALYRAKKKGRNRVETR